MTLRGVDGADSNAFVVLESNGSMPYMVYIWLAVLECGRGGGSDDLMRYICDVPVFKYDI